MTKQKLLPTIFLSLLSMGCFTKSHSMDHAGGCDIYSKNSCEQFEKCTAVSKSEKSLWTDNFCRTHGTKQIGEICEIKKYPSSGEDDCDKGLFCRGDNLDSLKGVCVKFCEGSKEFPICSSSQKCQVYYDGIMPLCIEK